MSKSRRWLSWLPTSSPTAKAFSRPCCHRRGPRCPALWPLPHSPSQLSASSSALPIFGCCTSSASYRLGTVDRTSWEADPQPTQDDHPSSSAAVLPSVGYRRPVRRGAERLLGGQVFLDGGVLRLGDRGGEINRHSVVRGAFELQHDGRLALGERQHRHSLGIVRRGPRSQGSPVADRNGLGVAPDHHA